MYVRPDRPLVVKCTFDRSNKHINFASAKNCCYDLLKNKIEQCFSLYATPYVISYKDDDGEVTDISTESDLTEAIQYFQAGSDDPPLSSAASILSGRSFGSKRRIALRVHITVDYDGPSLSDTSSLASLEEYKGRNKSSGELSWPEMSSTGKPEDDDRSRTASPFEHALSLSAQDRGAAWLREQNERTIKAMLGSTPEPSESDSRSVSMSYSEDQRSEESIGGDLALQRDPRGKYYYSYTGGSSSTYDSGYEDGFSVKDENEVSTCSSSGGVRPNSVQLSWLASQRKIHDEEPGGVSAAPSSTSETPFTNTPDTPDLLQFLVPAGPPPGTLTTCSECGVLLDAIRYVCAMCGEKEPISYPHVPSEPSLDVGKGKERTSEAIHSYPPHPHPPFQLASFPSPSGTDLTVWSHSPHICDEHRNDKPLPCLPSSGPTLYSSRGPGHLSELENVGYELCSGCIESAGIHHALCASTERVGSVSSGSTSPEDAMSEWLRSAPRHKGQLRHAYFEKVWGPRGWNDVEQEDMQTCRCSTCNTAITGKRYKCASCKKFNLCRACYSQVHDIHPAHAFLLVMEKPARLKSEPEYLPSMEDANEEQSMKHPGVKCAHCLQDILGARFHCAICDSVDICSNCESAGLPGNLDSSEGGHLSSHIMIKIPYPLETHEVQTASRRAIHLWTDRDAAHVLTTPHSKPSSVYSSYAQTVVGSRMRLAAQDDPPEDHRIICDGCREVRA
ncbi:hypothetical protein JVT61DRAFT_67 [Boletus reticuloceps]|uniref:Uncharacterized protein n=1 Tax=Boletus reticuloceps TaxID=495285 RepID=A0A8I3AGE9_9AGAM|nr:hypothetical protein JVT61DRAFT_67 [Boletus reticuloceps]